MNTVQELCSMGRLSHAYLISSGSCEKRDSFAYELASAMVCGGDGDKKPCGVCRDCRKAAGGVHPDIITVERDTGESGKAGREIYVDKIRAIIADASVMPNEADKKVYLIKEADTMNVSAQNAMLKLLEEPPVHSCFILCAGKAEAMLPTVRSRCTEINVNAESDALSDGAKKAALEYFGQLSKKSRASILRFCCSCEDMDNGQAAEFIAAAKKTAADMLCGRCGSMGISRGQIAYIGELLDTAERYLYFNVGIKHVFGFLAVRTLEF